MSIISHILNLMDKYCYVVWTTPLNYHNIILQLISHMDKLRNKNTVFCKAMVHPKNIVPMH